MENDTRCAGCGGAMTEPDHIAVGRHPVCENARQLHERLGIPRGVRLADHVERLEREQAYGGGC